MDKYKHLYLWAIVPFVIVQAGIFPYYWPKFSTVHWEFHIHYWLVSAWFILIIVQSYLITHNKIENHRLIGILGMLIAGGVFFTSVALLDVPLKLVAQLSPDRPGPPVAFYFGTLVLELIMALAFCLAVIMSIVNRKNLHEHSWWLICSLFYLMMPAIGRGMIVFWRSVLPPDSFTPLYPLVSSELIYLTLFMLFAVKFGRIRHLASYIALGLIIVRALRFPIGNSETIQALLQQVIRW